MTKAKLTGGQVGAAVVAGIIGHLFFASGWLVLGITLLGGLIVTILGGTLAGLGGDLDVGSVFGEAGDVFSGVLLGLVIAAAVLIVLGIVFSGLILGRGKVRKPWGTTWTAVLIAAIVDLPLLFAYLAVARATDGLPFPLVAGIGTVVVGILVWLWMTWAHRGPAEAVVVAPPKDAAIHVKRD